MAEQDKVDPKAAEAAKKKADAELAKGNAVRVNEQFAVFHLSERRFLQQAGEMEPRYIAASADAPVQVILPAKILRPALNEKGKPVIENGVMKMVEVDQPEDAHLKRDRQAAPIDVRPGLRVPKPAPAHEAIKKQLVAH